MCLQGNGTVKKVPVKQQPPIRVGDLIEGAKYHLRVYSHEHVGISSQSYTFETGTGETAPPTLAGHFGEEREREGT